MDISVGDNNIGMMHGQRGHSSHPYSSAYVKTEPFYLLRDQLGDAEISSNTNLIALHGLEHSYNKFCSKKVKEPISAFLPNLPGMIDTPGSQDNSSLRSLIEKPPIVGKELTPLSGTMLTGFRLHPGPIPEQYRLPQQQPVKKNKKKKLKRVHREADLPEAELSTESLHEKKQKKREKRHHEESERRKKRKEKKRKKRHSPSPNRIDSMSIRPSS